jgi:PmbA protein
MNQKWRKLTQMAVETEETARAMEGITNSEGAGAGWARSTTGLVTSDGFAENYSATSWSLSCAVLAGNGDNMERDYAGTYSSAQRRFGNA